MARLEIQLPKALLDSFRKACERNIKSMSDTLRDLIKEYLKGEK